MCFRTIKSLVIALFAALSLSTAYAEEGGAKDPEGYEPVAGEMMNSSESIPAGRLVASAYGFIFVAVLVYVASVGARSRRLEEELDELKRKLASTHRPG